MSEKKEYKPVMVIYFEYAPSEQEMCEISESLNKQEGVRDYPKLIVVNAKENKVEIISVDKATVAEDIQKYIDEKVKREDFFPDIDTSTYLVDGEQVSAEEFQKSIGKK